MPARATDFVRQIQLLEPGWVVYDIPVSGKTGEILSKPLEGEGAIFQLYAYQDETYDPFSLLDLNAGDEVHVNVSLDSHLVDADLLGIHLDGILGGSEDTGPMPRRLDEITVGTHLPTASVTLGSEDPCPTPRTRADRPYRMQLSIRNLAAPGDPRGGIMRLTLERDFKFYHPDLHVPYPDGSGQGSYDQAWEFTRNGDFEDPTIYQALPAARPTKACGEETFAACVQLGEDREAVITSSKIQVWPVCDGIIEGIDPTHPYHAIPSEVRAVCHDLYPDSQTYVQIYPGSEILGTVGRVVASSVISYNTYAPQDAVLPIEIDPADVESDGRYTLELLTVTPFDGRRPERVAHITFDLDRTIEVRGTLSTSEK
ncbi:hypothetical protein Hsar01_00637 [Haloferula sargassicola]|uniref:Uncharacterized protein n=2 Tax=Haloferula sargassicola TaxID=490096 RepID=A0ABP9UNR9_9BACT